MEQKRKCQRCGERKRITAFEKAACGGDARYRICRPCRVYAHWRGQAEATCISCGKTKPVLLFGKCKRAAPECRWCKNAARAYRAKLYGITQEQYDAMLTAQRNRCLICKERRPLVVDHDHDTGIVRGLLCHNCNAGIGLLQDDPILIERATSYVLASQRA